MAPTEIEKNMKKVLDERTIRPSERAWEQISAGIPSRPRKRHNGYYYYGIAAGFAGILLVVTLVFRYNNPSDNSLNKVPMRGPADTESVKATKAVSPEQLREQAPDAANQSIADKERGIASKETKQRVSPRLPAAETPGNGFPSDRGAFTEDKVIDEKVAEVYAQVQAMEDGDRVVTESEVDALLRSAQEQILQERSSGQDRSVDAMALLSEVEYELDRTLRDELFDKLKDGYLRVRTAVASRND